MQENLNAPNLAQFTLIIKDVENCSKKIPRELGETLLQNC